MKQIQDTADIKMKDDLERELDRLVARMETKGEQIGILKQHERQHNTDQKRKGKGAQNNQNKRSLSLNGSQVEVITTIKTKSKPKNETRHFRSPTNEIRGGGGGGGGGGNRGTNNLEVLKKVQKLQGTLRQDDLSWD